MRSIVIALAVVTVLFVAPAVEAGSNIQSAGKFGLGVQVGYPFEGVSMNWFMSKNTSLQIGVALWLNDHWTGIGGRLDYLWWMPKLATWSWADLGWYWGPGVNLFYWSWDGKGPNDGYIGVGAELPVGIGLQFAKAPIDLNLEAVPVLRVLGSDGIDIGFHIGGVLNARYYF